MARPGNSDRGLLSRVNVQGQRRWYVRLAVGGRMRQYGSWSSKDKARAFYETTRTRQRERTVVQI